MPTRSTSTSSSSDRADRVRSRSALLGSVSRGILHESKRPVLVVRGDRGPRRPAGICGYATASKCSRHARATASREAVCGVRTFSVRRARLGRTNPAWLSRCSPTPPRSTLPASRQCSAHPGGGAMIGRRFWEIGGFVAGAVLILFGAAAIYMGVDGRNTVRDSLKDEQVFFSTAEDEDAGHRQVRVGVVRRAGHDRRPGSGVRDRSCASTSSSAPRA